MNMFHLLQLLFINVLDEKEDKSVSSDDSNKKDAAKSWIFVSMCNTVVNRF